MELFHANRQWATRPSDQRFRTLEGMLAVTKQYAAQAKEKEVPWSDLRVEASGDDLRVVGRANVPALVSNYAFGQLTARSGAPSEYLRSLPGTLAAQNINHGLKARGDDKSAQLLFHNNDDLLLRAVTSDLYSRIWNHEVIAALIAWAARTNSRPAAQTFNWSGAALDPSADLDPALYASDHDMFAFMMSQDRVLKDPVGQSLFRGLIVRNSEVGDASLRFTGFYFRDICCNHIIWGAQDLAEVRLAHVGKQQRILTEMGDALAASEKFMLSSGSTAEKVMESAMVTIGSGKEAVVEKLFSMKPVRLSRKTLELSYDAVVPMQDGSPDSVWGFVQGVTRHAKTIPFADERNSVDRAAGRLLSLTF